MARQVSVFKFLGPLGEVSMYDSKYGYITRKKGGASAKQIKNSKAFERTRQHHAEFGRAAKASQLLRIAFYQSLLFAKETFTNARLIKVLTRIVKSDPINGRGDRTVMDGPIEQLLEFDFSLINVKKAFEGKVQASYDRTSNTFNVDFHSSIPPAGIAVPAGATHIQLVASATALDFNTQERATAHVESEMINVKSHELIALSLTKELTANNRIVFVAAGVQFHQEVNGTYYELKDRSANALSIVVVDKVESAAVA